MSVLCFLDCETTGLHADRRAWEIALIRRESGKEDIEHQWFIDVDSLDLGNAELIGLNIGRFYQRHPQMNGTEHGDLHVVDEVDALRHVEYLTRGAHIIGGVPSFDAYVLGERMRANGICPSWHYHLVDFETLIVGYLRGRGEPVPDLPWRSDDISRLIDVEPPSDEERHTAMGDCRWAKRVWDRIMGDPAVTA